MAVELNHTIVPARDPQASARFLAGILALAVGPPMSQFIPLTLANAVTLDFDRSDHPGGHHYAFQVSDDEFDAAFTRIKNQGIICYADPACRQPGQAYASKNGRRGTYFRDPDGHLMEILTHHNRASMNPPGT
jgi:catechol 2,3-dioxygenase-like lactoylglutathione lyase family enzyme